MEDNTLAKCVWILLFGIFLFGGWLISWLVGGFLVVGFWGVLVCLFVFFFPFLVVFFLCYVVHFYT